MTTKVPADMSNNVSNSPELLTQFHENLLQSLRNSKLLNPLYVEVYNESYWYYMRHRLNPKRHSYLQVKYNQSNLKYEAFIYDLKRRDEDLEIVPKKVLVGAANSKWQAYKLGEQAMKERDRNRPIIPDEQLLDPSFRYVSKRDLVANTHFRIVIVSDSFKRVSASDRLYMTLGEVLSGMGVYVDPTSKNHLNCPPSQFKLSSTFGPAVCNLSLFQFLPPADVNGTYLQISAFTPSQWRPDQYKPILSERLGQSHSNVQQLQIDTCVKPSKQKLRVKKLTAVPEKNATTTAPRTVNTKEHMGSMADTLGLDPSISGVAYDQLGGIYGHFFNDLSTDVRDMVLNKYKDNKELIRLVEKQPSSVEQKQNKTAYLANINKSEEEPSFEPRTNLAKLRSKLNVDGKRGNADSGTSNEDEMREEVLISNKRIEMAALRIQRIRRINMLMRTVKNQWMRQYSALTIQRTIRGQFGRRYACMFSRLKPIAASRIQKFYRDLKRYCILKMWNYLTYRLSRIVLPKIKRFINNCFISWIRKRNASATAIQKICRGRIARVKVYKIYGQRLFFKDLYNSAATQLQKIVRGFFARKYYQEVHIPQKLFFIIEIPAVIRIQRIFRGRIAKSVAARKRYELKCLLLLQKVIKAFVRRVWDEQKRIAQLEKNSATIIQRHYRGYYDRKLYKLKYYFYWYDHIYIPTIIKVQSSIRCFHARRIVNSKLRKMKAAVMIQKAYRFYRRYLLGKEIRRKLLEARRNQNIILIQKHIRRFLYRKKYERMLLTHRGRQLYAAKIILRAWRSYKLNQKYQILLENHRKEVQDNLLKKYLYMRKDIKRDIKELRNDISISEKSKDRYKARLKELESYLSQSEFRLNKIKTEMGSLTYEDFERGWAEALGQEYEFIIHQKLLAKEEIRLVRNRILNLEREILQLFLELEETEMEFDDVDSFSNEMVEKSRVVHLQKAERKASYHLNRLIYRERVHWKVESNRVNKMKNMRYNYQAIIKESQANRPFGYYTTVSYEQRKQRVEYEELVQQRRLRNEARDRDEKSRPQGYEEYSVPFQQVYDRLISNNLDHLRGFTLDERAARLREQQLSNQVVAKRSQKGQFASLKEDFR